MDFKSLRAAAYHAVSVGPFEPPTTQLLGSDIVAHLCPLEYYASQCDVVVEFGVRTGQSTMALLSGAKKIVISVDIEHSPIVDVLHSFGPVIGNNTLPCLWLFIEADTGAPIAELKECDMLFIDTLHTYEHVKKELTEHGRKATKYLAFHDTFTCGITDISGPNPQAPGILAAIEEFIAEFPGEYKTVYRTNNNNGLWVLERV